MKKKMKTAVVAIAATFLFWPAARATAETLAAGPEHALVITPDGRVLSWGRATSGRLGNGAVDGLFPPTTVAMLADVVAVAAGRAHSVALRRDGTVWTWGDNSRGQLGTGGDDTATPVQVPAVHGIAAIAAGDDFTLAWSIDGSIQAWGSNAFGQLGTGDLTDRPLPVRVARLGPALRIAAGARHSVAVLLDGSVWSWGDNGGGQLGHGDAALGTQPGRVAGLPPAVSIAAGDAHTLVLANDGRVWSWGIGSPVPSLVEGLPPIIAIAAGGEHSLALAGDGFVWAWGSNDFGELGDGTQQPAIAPVRLSRPVGVTDIAAGKTYSLAKTRGGALWGWGDTRHGQLGDTTVDRKLSASSVDFSAPAAPSSTVATPTFFPVAGPYFSNQSVVISSTTSGASIYYTTDGSDPTQSSTPYTAPVLVDHSLTLKARGYKTGSNPSAIASGVYTLKPTAPAFTPAAGTYPSAQSVTIASNTPGTTIRVTLDLSVPTSSSPLYTGPITVGRPMTLKARAFKTNWTDSDVTTATYTVTNAATGSMIAAGPNHTAVLKPDGTVWSWGDGGYGEMGNGGTSSPFPPTQASITGVKAIAVGYAHTLALKTDGTVWGWGANFSGELGNGNTNQQNLPVRCGTLTSIIAIAAGDRFSLAVDSSGAVYAWGLNSSGQLGDGSNLTRLSPVKLKSFTVAVTGARLIVAGTQHVLVRKADNSLWAWGANGSGQLGNGTQVNSNKPVQVTNISGVVSMAAGVAHSLAIKADGTILSWGSNAEGALGDPSQGTRLTPGQIPGLQGIVQVAAGYNHSLAVSNDGHMWTWGDNSQGQIGNGVSGNDERSPVALTLFPVAQVAGGAVHSAAITDDGTVWSWGADRTPNPSKTPRAISIANFFWKAAAPTLTPPGGCCYSDTVQVTLSTTTPGATRIYYTLDGSVPSSSSTWISNNGSFGIFGATTINARVLNIAGLADSDVTTGEYVFQAAAPTFDPPSGTIFQPTPLRFQCGVGGTAFTVYYTTAARDPIPGSDPSATCNTVSSLTVSSNVTVRAMATRAGFLNSPVSSASYTVKVGAPTYSPGGGTYTSTQTVRISTVTPGATVRYTTDGTEPTTVNTSMPSGSTVSVGGSLVLKARAFLAGWPTSDLMAQTYTLTLAAPAAPTMTPGAGTYASTQTITLSTSTTGAVIRYTLDGTDPTFLSALYQSPISVVNGTTIKAKAFQNDRAASATTTAAYIINLSTVGVPRLSPPGGWFSTQTTVVITCDTPGSTLHYTTSGAEPTSADPSPPPGGVLVDRTQTLKVMATASGLPDSPVDREAYVITGAVAAGDQYTVALKADGTVWSWGQNTHGQIGDGSFNSTEVPIQAAGLSGVVAISTRGQHTLALKADGTVWAWGNNSFGQLGDNTTTDRPQPILVTIPNLQGAVVVAVSAGAGHSLALSSAGKVYYWGYDPFYGTVHVPTQLTAFSGGVTQISAGNYFSMALKSDGASSGNVWLWGDLGGPRGAKPAVLDFSGATAFFAGGTYSLGFKSDGVFGWGSNGWGQLGYGTPSLNDTYQYEISPRPLFNLGTLSATAAGSQHTLTIDTAARVWAWGSTQYGATAATTNDISPHLVPGLSNAIRLAAGVGHSVAVKEDGTVWTWGWNIYGQLANGTPFGFSTATPAPVINFSVVANGSLTDDPDGDGLSTQDEYRLGTDPFNPDTNGDGIPDGIEIATGTSATNPDMDGDGVTNAVEITRGTDPFQRDTDGDGVNDGADCFPLDPARTACPPPVPGDTTPPVITLQEPTNAQLLSSVPPQ